MERSYPVGPVAPVSPVDPVAPGSPVEPVTPVGPGPPVGPVAPVTPVVPDDPDGPVNPVLPDGPVAPVAPVDPVAPVGPPVQCRRPVLSFGPQRPEQHSSGFRQIVFAARHVARASARPIPSPAMSPPSVKPAARRIMVRRERSPASDFANRSNRSLSMPAPRHLPIRVVCTYRCTRDSHRGQYAASHNPGCDPVIILSLSWASLRRRRLRRGRA